MAMIASTYWTARSIAVPVKLWVWPPPEPDAPELNDMEWKWFAEMPPVEPEKACTWSRSAQLLFTSVVKPPPFVPWPPPPPAKVTKARPLIEPA